MRYDDSMDEYGQGGSSYGARRGRHRGQPRRYFGKYRGYVVDTIDKKSKGRIRVRVPAVTGDEKLWAMPCVPYAGQDVGFYFIPDRGAGVWIEFEAGELNHPIWVGCFWGDGQVSKADAVPGKSFVKTSKLAMNIDANVGKMEICNTAGAEFSLAPEEIKSSCMQVTQEARGRKIALTPASCDINGAFTVV